MKKTLWFGAIVLFGIIVLLPYAYLFLKIGSLEHVRSILNLRTGGLLLNSLIIAFGSMLLSLLIGLPLGFLLERTDVYGKRVACSLFVFPLLVPSYINAIAWLNVLGPSSTKSFGIFSLYGVIGVLTLSYFPLVTLLVIAGLRSINPSLEEQANMLSHPWSVLRKVIFPLIAPFVISAAFFVFVFSLSNYAVPSLLRINTFPIEIFIQFSVHYNQQAAILTSLPLLLITSLLILITSALIKDKSFIGINTNRTSRNVFQLKRWRGLSSLFVWSVIFVSSILPLLALIVSSKSWKAYVIALKTSYVPIMTSVGISILGASACVLIGFFLAHFIERSKGMIKKTVDFATLLPLAIAPTILGIGLISIWNRPETKFIYGGVLIMVFVLVARFIPFAVRIILSGLKQVHPNLEEAADLDEASFIKKLHAIICPSIKSSLFLAWFICYIFCMGECEAMLLVVPAGMETLANKIFSLMHYGVGQLTSALAVILILAIILPVLVYNYLSKENIYD